MFIVVNFILLQTWYNHLVTLFPNPRQIKIVNLTYVIKRWSTNKKIWTKNVQTAISDDYFCS